jgi:hypothetical protein
VGAGRGEVEANRRGPKAKFPLSKFQTETLPAVETLREAYSLGWQRAYDEPENIPLEHSYQPNFPWIRFATHCGRVIVGTCPAPSATTNSASGKVLAIVLALVSGEIASRSP